MTDAQDEPPSSAGSRLLIIHDGLNDLRRFIEGVWMAAGDVTDQSESRALHALLDVAGAKIDAMREAMQEARDLLAGERKETV